MVTRRALTLAVAALIASVLAVVATAGPALAAGEPTSLGVSSGDASLVATWTAPTDVTPVTYLVRHREKGTSTWTTSSAITHPTLTYTLSTLTNGTIYEVEVSTSNPGPSSWVSAEGVAGAPGNPSGLTLASGNQQLEASWTAPANNGSAITDYDVRYRSPGAASWVGIYDGGKGQWTNSTSDASDGANGDPVDLGQATGLDVTLTREAIGNNHGVYKLGSAADEIYLWFHLVTSFTGSATVQVRYASTKPTATNLLTHGSQLASKAVSPTTRIWGTTPALAAGSYFWVATSVAGSVTSSTSRVWVDTQSTSTSETLTGLGRSLEYEVQVRASNARGNGSWSSSTKLKTNLPETPGSPTVTPGSTSLAVAWTASSGNGHTITDYDLRYSSDSGATWTEWDASTTSTATAATVTGLTNGTTYQVQVRAVSTAGNGPWSLATTATAGAPVAPSAPTLESDNASLEATWSAPASNGSSITDYDVQYSSDSGATWTEWDASTTSTATTATITGLVNGTSYDVRVRAANGRGDGPWSAATTLKAGAPSAPAAPSLTSGNAQLAVAWTAPADNGSSITDYDVRYSSDSGATWSEWDASTTSTATIATITGLTNGTTYQVQVRAANARADGKWSSSATRKAGLPAAPSAPTLTVDNTALSVAWSAPAANGSSITDYDVQYSSDSGSTWTEWDASTTSTATTATVTGLTNNTAYQVQVRAVNSVGDGPWSASASASPTAQKPNAPAAPTLVSGNASLEVSWSAPAANGSSITDYDVQYSSDSGSTWTEWDASTTSTATTATVTGLTNNTAYQVQVRAVNSVGDGPWSASATLKAGLPAAPAVPELTPGNGSLRAAWTAPSGNGSAISGYDVQYSSDSGTTWLSHTHTGTGTSATIPTLTNGTSYEVQVRAVNSVGDGPWSPSATATAGAPAPPIVPTLAVGNTQLAVAWAEPATNGAAITDYDVRYRADGTTTWTEWKAANTSTATAATITGLTNSTTYHVAVRAGNSRGDGPWSASTSAAPAAQAPDAPAKPTLLGTQLAYWTAPANNGAAITDYDIQYSSDSGATWTEWDPGDTSTSTLFTLNKLPGGSTYVLQVRAENSVGAGAWSPTTDSVTLPARRPDTPAAPMLSSDNKSMEVSWTAPEDNGSDITDYDVRHSTDQVNWTTVEGGTADTSTSATITGLTNNWTYWVQVRATNSVGDSAWSQSESLKVGVPSTPSAPKLTSGNTQLGVSWTVPESGGSPITDYDVQYSSDSGTTWTHWDASTTSTDTTTTITGLTNGTAYEVQVRAKNQRGNGFWSASSSETPGKPSAPSAPTLTAGRAAGVVDTAQLTVTWTAPTTNGLAVNDYDVQYSSDSGTTWTEWNASNTSTTTTATITGLAAGTWQVQVRAASSAGDGPWSASASQAVTTAPAAPTMPKLASGTSSLSASWTASANGGSSITGYAVQYRAAGAANWTSSPHTGTTASAAITGLNNGTAYEVQVRAVNAIGSGPWSASAVGKAGAPSVPLDVWVLARGGSLEVSWLVPATDNGSDVTDYDVRYREVGTSAWSETADTTQSTWWKQTISSLTNGTAYEVQVRAENANGSGHWSATITRDPGAPGEPRRPYLTAGNAQLGVSWAAPAADHGSPITDYDVRYSSDRGSTWTEWDASTTSTATSTTVTGLVNGVVYYVQVRAANARGDGWWSHSSVRRTVIGPEYQACKPNPSQDPNLATVLIYGASCDIKAGRDGVKPFDEVEIANTPNVTGEPLLVENRKKDNYVRLIAFNPNGGTAWVRTKLNGTRQDHFKITMPAFGIKGVTAVGNTTGGPGSTFKLRVQLDYPANVTEVEQTYTGYPLRSWVQLGFPANSGFTGTDHARSGYVSDPKQIVGQYKDTVEFTVKAGTTAGQFPITVTAKSPWSGWWCSNSQTGEVCFNPPSPTDSTLRYSVATTNTSAIVTAQAGVPAVPPQRVAPELTGTARSLTATWSPPLSPAGPITAYDVQYRHHPNGAWTLWETLGAEARSSTITGLESGGIYRVRIRAQNAFGWGNYSWPFAEVTLPNPQAGPPAAPAAVEVSRTTGELRVSWPAVEGASGYNVVFSSDNKSSWTRAYSRITETSVTITGVDDNAAYYVAVQAFNAAGSSGWADSSLIPVRPANLPGQFTPELTPGRDSIKVAWKPPMDNGSAITAYEIEYRPHPGGTWTVHATLDGTARTHTITGLEPGGTYRVRMRARNADGWGDKSWPLAETTLGARAANGIS